MLHPLFDFGHASPFLLLLYSSLLFVVVKALEPRATNCNDRVGLIDGGEANGIRSAQTAGRLSD
jgi:hypothetical protein